MKDEDLLVVVAEMLRKKDQHSEILNQHSVILKKAYQSLASFIEDSEHPLNERFLEHLESIQQFNQQIHKLSQTNENHLDDFKNFLNR